MNKLFSKKVKVKNQGMIRIPAELRKKFDIKDGDYVIFQEDERGDFVLKKIESEVKIREKALDIEKFKEVYKKSRQEDLELEI
ncbi:MAG: hypothetical protein BAJALOKI2v1_840022 [Promethearchaeota archaeon]|nr:MAG: hypothetical protein BAJALOKI2v1_840022 [Candidatus Lokiarchaeota archaeon]